MRRVVMFGCLALAVPGCAQKSAAKVVDPTLLAEGRALERTDGTRTKFVLGDYVFEQVSLDRAADAKSTGLSPDGQSRPTERIDLQMTMQNGDRLWAGACRAFREPTGRSDYAAVQEEFHDVVAIDCTFEGTSEQTWTFSMKGSLATNLGGTLTPSQGAIVGGRLEVEVLMWRNVWNRVRRHLPEPVAQVRLKRGSTAAMILDRPERAWIEPSTPRALLDVSMTALGALRMLPLGFEG